MPEWIITVIIGVIAAAPGVYAVMAGRHKAQAESSQIVTDTAVRLLAPLEARIKVLEARVAKLETENEVLETQAREFRARVARLEQENAALLAEVREFKVRVAKLEEENEGLMLQAREFKATIQEFRELVVALWGGIVVLSRQLDCNGITPEWNMAQYKERVEKVLGIVE